MLAEWAASERTVAASVELIGSILGEPINPNSLDFEASKRLKEQLKEVPLDEFKKSIKAVVRFLFSRQKSRNVHVYLRAQYDTI